MKDADDIYMIREMLETEAIRRFVQVGDDKAIKELVRIHKQIAKALTKDNVRQLAGVASEFYETILQGSKSKVIYEVARPLLARVNYLRIRSMSEPGRLDGGLREWDAMIKAVTDGDAEAAAAAMGTHLRNARTAIVARLAAEEAEANPSARKGG